MNTRDRQGRRPVGSRAAVLGLVVALVAVLPGASVAVERSEPPPSDRHDEQVALASQGPPASLDHDQATLTVGETHQILVTIPDWMPEFTVARFANDPDNLGVVAVSDTGLVTALAPGTARIEVRIVDIAFGAVDEVLTFVVDVVGEVDDAIEPVTINVNDLSLQVGDTAQVITDWGSHQGIYSSVRVHTQHYPRDGTPVVSLRSPGMVTGVGIGSVELEVEAAYRHATTGEREEETFRVRVRVRGEQTTVRVSDLFGEVYIIPAEDPDDFSVATLDSVIYEGDEIETRGDSGAILSLENMATISMGSNSILRIVNAAEGKTNLELLIGRMWTNITRMLIDGSMDVELSQAVFGIRGTLVAFEEDGTTSTARVVTGAVEVVPTGTAQGELITAGQQAAVTGAGMQTSSFSAEEALAELTDFEREALLGDDGPGPGPDPGTPTPPVTSFPDVDPYSPHAAGIAAVAEAGITTGRADGTFGPGLAVRRDQMATFLARALELADPGGSPFTDVAPDSVHAPGIRAVAAADITTGVGPGRFAPEQTVSRAQMATFLTRALELADPGWDTFTDVAPDSVHAPGIRAVAAAGITTGVGGGRFDPAGQVTRAQMATFLFRAVLDPDAAAPAPDPSSAITAVRDALEVCGVSAPEEYVSAELLDDGWWSVTGKGFFPSLEPVRFEHRYDPATGHVEGWVIDEHPEAAEPRFPCP